MRALKMILVAGLLGGWAATAQAADEVTLQLKWVTQAQFAGYYVALNRGFYKGEDLDVTIKPGGPDIAPTQVLAGGGADVVVEWMPAALAAREKGLPLVNIAQPFKSSGLMLTCRKDAGISTTDDFRGKTLGVWFFGNEYPFLNWMDRLGIPTDGSSDGVTVLKQGFNVAPLLEKQAACISTMIYNEYWQVIDAGLAPSELVVFKYEDEGVATLEDGLYVSEDRLQDPEFENKMVRFVRASMKGWKYAEQNPDEAAEIVLGYDATGAQTFKHQRRMMDEVAKLTAGSDGSLDPLDYQRTVDVLLTGGSDPVIRERPKGAWTSQITDSLFFSPDPEHPLAKLCRICVADYPQCAMMCYAPSLRRISNNVLANIRRLEEQQSVMSPEEREEHCNNACKDQP